MRKTLNNCLLSNLHELNITLAASLVVKNPVDHGCALAAVRQ
jgi:hypothetical protein